jgi:hypothetical protein
MPTENTEDAENSIRRSARIRSGRVLANLTNQTTTSSNSGRVTKRPVSGHHSFSFFVVLNSTNQLTSHPPPQLQRASEEPTSAIAATTTSSSSTSSSSSKKRSSRSTSRSRASNPRESIAPEGPVYECDIVDKNSPHMATEYINDLYGYHKEIEVLQLL